MTLIPLIHPIDPAASGAPFSSTLGIRNTHMGLLARDHYYKNVAPEENWQNYQKFHQHYIYVNKTDEGSRRIISHVPKFSNDILLEGYVTELLETVSQPIADRLRNLFVAKRKNFFANAGAAHSTSSYEGDLIFFYVGLSDVLFQYAILFEDFTQLTKARSSLGDDAEPTRRLFVRLCEDIQKLTSAQLDWGIKKNEIRFKDETVLVPDEAIESRAADIATLMDKAVLRHEIAHHLLGHTTPHLDTSTCPLEPIQEFLDDAQLSSEHRRELEADLGAIFLPFSNEALSDELRERLQVEVVLGTLLAQTTLAQLKASIHVDASSHPSWRIRHELSVKALKRYYDGDYFDDILNNVERFQALLFLVQERGLGELTAKKFHEVEGNV